jgi:hypothetical protein
VGIAADVIVSRVTQSGGTSWYFLPGGVTSQKPSCWLYGPSTTESNVTDMLPSWLAMLDYQLGRQKVTFEQFIELDNLLSDPSRRNLFGHQRLATSGLLHFKMLQLLERALAEAQRTAEYLDADPFRKAWLIAHEPSVNYFDPAGMWIVPGKPYWDIYEQNKDATWAEEIAWVASQHSPATDACEIDCVLHSHIIEGSVQYWRRFPNGPHIAEALHQAAGRAKSAGCTESEVTRGLVEQIRTSLAEVTHPEKLEILKYLSEIERPCPR